MKTDAMQPASRPSHSAVRRYGVRGTAAAMARLGKHRPEVTVTGTGKTIYLLVTRHVAYIPSDVLPHMYGVNACGCFNCSPSQSTMQCYSDLHELLVGHQPAPHAVEFRLSRVLPDK